MIEATAREVWERPEVVRMDAADAQAGISHHADGVIFRRQVAS